MQRPSANPNDNPATWWEQRILPALEKRINRPSFNTWLRPTTCLRLDATTCEIAVPDDVFCYWLEEYYMNVLRDEIEQQAGRQLEITFIVLVDEDE
jgi:chromosomal replication initiator protein